MPVEVIEDAPSRAGAGSGPDPVSSGGGPDAGPGASGGLFGDPALFGLCAFLASVAMLFVGLTSAYMVRRGAADWDPVAAPPLLYLNTVVLLASGAALQAARRRLLAPSLAGARGWTTMAGALGLLFLVGQYGAWQALRARGVYLATSPHSSFFFVLTGLHALHLVGGIAWFLAVLRRVGASGLAPGEDRLRLLAVYWHFLTGLWVFLLVLLFAL